MSYRCTDDDAHTSQEFARAYYRDLKNSGELQKWQVKKRDITTKKGERTMTLYEIQQEIALALEECTDIDTGEIVDFDRIHALNLKLDEKLENIALALKNARAELEAFKVEKQAFDVKIKRVNKRIEGLSAYLDTSLDGTPFKTSKVSITYRKTSKLEIAQSAKIPEEYLRYSAPEPNKVELTKAVKAGTTFEGISLVESRSMQLK